MTVHSILQSLPRYYINDLSRTMIQNIFRINMDMFTLKIANQDKRNHRYHSDCNLQVWTIIWEPFINWVWYFVPKIVREKVMKFKAEDWEFAKFEITRTIHSNSERSEWFLVTECFFNLFLEISHIS